MSMNNFLVTGVIPASNELYVPLERDIVITFQKHMDPDSLHAGNIRLRAVNGALVSTTLTYDGLTQTLTVSHAPLEPGVQYQLEIVGGETGVNSMLGEYLSNSRYYEFTTTSVSVTPSIEEVTVEVDGPYVSVQWSLIGMTESERLEYKVSTFPEPESVGVYPSNSYQVSYETALDVPRRLDAGQYYMHSRIMREEVLIATSTKSFLVEEKDEQVPNVPAEPSPETTFEELTLIESYPRQDAYGVGTSTKIGLRFSEAIDKDAYHYSWVMIQKMEGDMFDISETTMTMVEDARPDVLAFEVSGLMENTSYDIMVSKDIKGLPGEPVEQMVDGTLIMVSGEAKTLGKDLRISFMTTSKPIYLEVSELKDDLGLIADAYSDIELYRRIGYASKSAYEIAARSPRFDSSLFSEESFPFYMKEYVKYSLAYDMTVQSIVSGGGTSGKSIALGDLSVRSEEGSQTTQRDMLKALKEKLRPWQDMLHGVSGRGYARMTSAVDQETGNPYPDFLETYGEYTELGG